MNVEFKDNNPFAQKYTPSEKTGLTGWLIKKGFAKDEKGSNQIMIVVSIICIAVAVYFAFN